MLNLPVAAAHANLRAVLDAPRWDGRVVAVFRTSILLADPHESLLHIHGGPQLVSPFSLRLEGTLTDKLPPLACPPGSPVHKIGQCLECPGFLRLWLGALDYYPSPRRHGAAVDPRALQVARQTLDLHGRPGGISAMPRMVAMTTVLQQAFVASDFKRMGEMARGLIGLGPGLTPSGDDFLVGWLRGLWVSAGESLAIHEALTSLRRFLLPDLTRQTTAVGAAFIRFALQGSFAEVLDRAAGALCCSSSPQAVANRIRSLISQGKTSGTDTTAGLLSCLEALFQHRPRQQGQPCQSGISSTGARTTIPSP